MQVTDSQLQTLLKNIPDAQTRRQLADIVSGKVSHEVYCLSEDVVETVEVPHLDKEGKPVLYSAGEKAGQPKTRQEERLVRKGCAGRLIARIYNDKRVVMVASEGKAWLRSSRSRFDGFKGFQCWCGNDSLLADQEKGHITAVEPNKEDLGAIWKNLQNNPTNYPNINGEQIIDGFMIKEIG